MNTEPLVGALYTYTGPIKSHHGLFGTASSVRRLTGRVWLVDLANHKEWTRLGIEPSLVDVPSTELEPLEATPAPTHKTPAPARQPKPKVQPLAPSTLFSGPEECAETEPEAWQGLEDELAQECIKWLESEGYQWAVVGQKDARGSGTTVGYPDLSLRSPSWPRGFWVLVELKTSEGTLSKEQEGIHDDGGSFVVRSVAALERVAEAVSARARVMEAAEALLALKVF